MMVAVMLIISLMEMLMFYALRKDIISPSFVFAAVFVVAEINLLTNVSTLHVSLSIDTVLVVTGGILFFALGCLFARKAFFKEVHVANTEIDCQVPITLNFWHYIGLLGFNVVSIFYILNEVYQMTVTKAYYSGNVLGSLSVYAEVSKFQDIDMKVSRISTLLTALCEAEAYVFSYVLAKNIVYKNKLNKMELLCFATAVLSTFCQGSRGGVWIIISMIFISLMLYREKTGKKSISIKLIGKVILIIIMAVLIFQLTGMVTGKVWDVSFYEYFSVYLGNPILNLDTAMKEGIVKTPIWGRLTFAPFIKKFFPMFGLTVPIYKNLRQFRYTTDGHNLGNVYTIFAPLIADFGIIGMLLALFIIGFICTYMYNVSSKTTNKAIALSKILYGYIITNIAFSFFSNKFCENISVYRMYVFAFSAVFSMGFTKIALRNNRSDLKKHRFNEKPKGDGA